LKFYFKENGIIVKNYLRKHSFGHHVGRRRERWGRGGERRGGDKSGLRLKWLHILHIFKGGPHRWL
jgi:hypothetical protein